MTLNYHAHGKEIEDSYKRVSEDSGGDKWVIYDYEGNSNTIRVKEEGMRLSSDVYSKIVLIHWQGEGVPTLRLASTTSHAEELRRHLKTVHIVLHARSEIDVEPEAIRKEVRKLPAANSNSNVEVSYSAPEKVGSVYQSTNAQSEFTSMARENFWSTVNQEEKKRQAEDEAANAEQLKRYEADRKRMAAEIQEKAEDYQSEKVNSVYKPTKPHVELKTINREEFWNKMNEEEKRRQEEEKIARETAHKQYEADRQRMASELHSKSENYQPDKVTSVYKPTKPHVEISSSAREEFWNKMNEEEKTRQAEEKELQVQRQKEFESDRKRIAEDLHAKVQFSAKPKPSAAPDSSHISPPLSSQTASSGLVGNRKKMFNSQPSEPVLLKSPVNGSGSVKKWPAVGTKQDSVPSVPVNRINEAQTPPEKAAAYKPEPMVYKPDVLNPAATTYDAYEEPPAEPALLTKTPISPPSFVAPTPLVAPPPPEPTPAHISYQYDAPPAFESVDRTSESASSHITSPYRTATASNPTAPASFYSSQYDVPPEPISSSKQQKTAELLSQYDMPPVMPDEPVSTPIATKTSARSPVIDQYDFPPAVEDQRAMALWDYQAADDTEISFDPDDIITEIDQICSGWWKGRAPNGRVGLFPANYVKLL